MTDIVDRLRQIANNVPPNMLYVEEREVMVDAAEELEKLRALVGEAVTKDDAGELWSYHGLGTWFGEWICRARDSRP